jgi:hypothetical protein
MRTKTLSLTYHGKPLTFTDTTGITPELAVRKLKENDSANLIQLVLEPGDATRYYIILIKMEDNNGEEVISIVYTYNFFHINGGFSVPIEEQYGAELAEPDGISNTWTKTLLKHYMNLILDEWFK